MMAVGNVSEHLADYKDSDTFLTRDGGFTWEEIRKDAHMYEFGDSGSVLVLVNDEGPTDRVLYSKDEGLAWKEYLIGQSIRVASIVTMTRETSRKFILFGHTSSGTSVDVHLDFQLSPQGRVYSKSKIPFMTTSSSGVPAKSEKNDVSSADKPCITDD